MFVHFQNCLKLSKSLPIHSKMLKHHAFKAV
jgi:hypothetical protein